MDEFYLERAVVAHEALQAMCAACSMAEGGEVCESCPIGHGLRLFLGEIGYFDPTALPQLIGEPETVRQFYVIRGKKE